MTSSSALMGVCILNNRTTLATPSFQSELGSQATSPQGYVIDPLTGSTRRQQPSRRLELARRRIFHLRPSRQLRMGSGCRGSHRLRSIHMFRIRLLATTNITSSSTPPASDSFYLFGLNNAVSIRHRLQWIPWAESPLVGVKLRFRSNQMRLCSALR